MTVNASSTLRLVLAEVSRNGIPWWSARSCASCRETSLYPRIINNTRFQEIVFHGGLLDPVPHVEKLLYTLEL